MINNMLETITSLSAPKIISHCQRNAYTSLNSWLRKDLPHDSFFDNHAVKTIFYINLNV